MVLRVIHGKIQFGNGAVSGSSRRLGAMLLRSIAFLVPFVFLAPLFGQLNQNCVVSVLNRTVQVNTDGTWVLPNIPANFGPVRARATCVNGGSTTFGQSAYFTIPANDSTNVPPIILGSASPVPLSVTVTTPKATLPSIGATAQLDVMAQFSTGAPQDVTTATAGTIYNVSNPAIATVSANGVVTAVSSGTAVIQAVNEGRQGIVTIQIVLAGVSHGGIPDSWAIAHGLDPSDPVLASEDPDHDGLTNLQEFQAGTDPNNPDTDGDGLTDGQEVLMYHTNPALFSTDGTGISDGIEVRGGTLNAPLSAKLHGAIQSLSVTPSHFVLDVNSIQGVASQQLAVTALLIDGKTKLDLTSTLEGTNYASSDLTICNFGTPDGNIFAGNNGSCTITITVGGDSATVTGIINSFTPTALSYISIPGFANDVAVNGDTAYVAAGSSGLQVVSVADRTNPSIIGSLALPGNANDVKLIGTTAYVASGSAGLQVVDVTKPTSPVLLGAYSAANNALTTTVRGTLAYIANGSSLVIADVTNPASIMQIGNLPFNSSLYGTDVDTTRKLAVVTAGGSGIYTVDISNPAAPVVLGNVSTGDARAVAIKGNYAFVADYVNSTTAVDITNPASPVVVSNITDPNLGGYLQDIAVSGNFALAADVKFFNGIPITDITNPTALIAREILNFTQRDDNGMGIAIDGSYAYVATEHNNLSKFGTSGDSRLYIGQYLSLVDNKGIAPKAAITAPLASDVVIEGEVLPILVNATDDIAVAAVNFLINGKVVFTATSKPYQFNYTVPLVTGPLTIGAVAVDLGGNTGPAKNVTVHVVPDPGTTVTGVVVDRNNHPLAGAAVVTNGGLSATTLANGSFQIAKVPTVAGSIFVTATAEVGGVTLRGFSGNVPPVRGGTTNVGSITVGVGNILLLADVMGDSTTALVNALTGAGNMVTVVAPEFSWDSTNPALTDFNCVIHLDGATYSTPLPVQSQTALETFVNNGGGFIGSQWDGYERATNIQTSMNDLVLQLWNTGNDQDCGECSVTYDAVPGQQGHPVLSGLPSSFTFHADGHSAGAQVPYATNPSTILMTIPAGGPAVLVRQFGNGRVVNFSFAPNYETMTTLLDLNVQKLYVNATAWACR